ncbi:MAG: N-acyl-D-amino-acid deacylase [Kiritimatiellia bacterium]|jgi:N-acyl-D-amino-acid deacylase
MYDLVLRNGFVVDGSGEPGFIADVAVKDGVIAEVGLGLASGRREVDCTGLMVTPGWVDMHTHYDGQVTWDPYLTPSGWHGVTTVVMGNCGVGFAPCRSEDREWLINVMEGVEDIPGCALTTGMVWGWQTFPEYLDFIDSQEHAVDFAAQIPHSAVRAWVMGRESSETDNATDEQIQQMQDVVAEALQAGALGFSTSRTALHKSAAGIHVGGTFAEEKELLGIAEALGRTGKGMFQLADEHLEVGKSMRWLRQIAEENGRPVCVNMSQTDLDPTLWQRVLPEIERAAADGVPLYLQAAGRAIGILMCWRGTAHPFVLKPTWHAKLAHLDHDDLYVELCKPEIRRALIDEDPVQAGPFEYFVTQSFHKMFDLAADGYEPAPDRSIAARAGDGPNAAAELAYDALMEADGQGFVYFPLFNYSDGNLDLLHTMHQHPQVMMGLSDGGAHCGAICDGGMPTFMLTHWARDRTRGPKLPVEYMVHRQTQQTARFYGMLDRGVIKPGYKADINVLDFAGLSLQAPRMSYDLPAGGRRLVQRADGYVMTVLSGEITFERGQPTGVLPGRLVRGSRGPVSTSPAAEAK